MCSLAHAAFAIFQKRGRFYNGRGAFIKIGIYMFPRLYISVLLNDDILELDMPNNFIGYEMGKIVCCYILLLVSFSVYRY